MLNPTTRQVGRGIKAQTGGISVNVSCIWQLHIWQLYIC